jgi:hypothetical protein
MEFTYTIQGLNELITDLDDISRNQLPFGTAVALTRTAQDVQREIIAQLSRRFTIRTGWWRPGSAMGINMKIATKENQQATVWTAAPFMILQETGGTKTPPGQFLAMPTEQVRRRGGGGRIPAGQFPHALIASGAAWVGKDRAGELVIFQRVGKRKVIVPYILKPSAKIHPRFEMIQTGIDVIDARWKQNWYVEMGKAIQTAK